MSTRSFQIALEAATNTKNTEENWDRILEVCDYIKNGQIKPAELLEQLLRRLKQTRKTKLQLKTLTLFDAAVQNCGQIFHQLFTSRSTMNILTDIINNPKTENIVRNRIGSLLKQWMEDPLFKDKAQYAMLSVTYKKLTTEKGYSFFDGINRAPTSNVIISSRKTEDELITKREEEEFTKAIALSNLKQVKALYDFEAAEDNEITFKSGDIIIIIDDSDQHWWKGINNGDEGLFPANFVTKNLQQQVDKKPELNIFVQASNPKQEPQNEISNKQIIIDESLINHCLAMLQNGAIETNSNDMLFLEDSCYAMGPLIDHELERVDRKQMQLLDINKNLLEVMDLYHHLMEEGRLRATQVKPIANQMYQPRPDLQSMPYAPFSGYYADPNSHQQMMHSMPSAQQQVANYSDTQ